MHSTKFHFLFFNIIDYYIKLSPNEYLVIIWPRSKLGQSHLNPFSVRPHNWPKINSYRITLATCHAEGFTCSCHVVITALNGQHHITLLSRSFSFFKWSIFLYEIQISFRLGKFVFCLVNSIAMAKKVPSIALHKKKPIKNNNKMKKVRPIFKKIWDYFKSDSYMFAPLLSPTPSFSKYWLWDSPFSFYPQITVML